MTIYGRSEELVSRCVGCDLAEPESLASLGGSAPGVVDGILSKPPVFESRCMRERSRKRASLTITHNDQTSYQTIHFKHNNTNTWAKTVPGINSNGISPTARTTGRTAPSCQILRGWYTSQPTRQSCISGKRGIE